MLLSGVAVDIGCFASDSAQRANGTGDFCDRFSIFAELPKLAPGIFSFSTEIGIREAFGNHVVLCAAVSGFRKLLLTPRLYTTGIHFDDPLRASSELEELREEGVQQIILRVNEHEARAVSPDCVKNLVGACQRSGMVLWLQFELHDTFSEECLRIARMVEEQQFTVTVLPVRIRPVRSLGLEEAIPLPTRERVQVVLNEAGEVTLRRRSQDEVVDVRAGNARERSLHELVAAARARG